VRLAKRCADVDPPLSQIHSRVGGREVYIAAEIAACCNHCPSGGARDSRWRLPD